MDRIREQITRNVLIGAGVGLALGLILGLFIAWVVWPVNVIDTEVKTMREDLQRDYLTMALQSFDKTGDTQEALRRWDQMGPDKGKYLTDLMFAPPQSIGIDKVNQFAAVVNAGTMQPGLPGLTQTEIPAETPQSEEASSVPWTIILVIMCLLTLLIGGLLAYLLLFRNRQPGIANNRSGNSTTGQSRVTEPVSSYPEGQATPIVQYLTTYTVGNDLYDDSFSIDSATGEFLGECGVGISETIGVGDPKKVTAFEVWLFDKNDIQTVTKVLMSQHAFNDPAISQRLTSKGEPVLAEPGKHILLETATLQLEARVVNMNYGQGALPASSYFEQLTLELQVWPKA